MAFDPTKYGARPTSPASPAGLSLPADGGARGGQADQVTPAGDGSGAAFPYTGDGSFAERSGLKAVGNLPGSFSRFLGGLGHAIAHPIDTVESIGGAAVGGLEQVGQKLGLPTPTGQIPKAQAVEKALYDRYGTLGNAARSATEDPFGVGADILGLAEGGASAARAVGMEGAPAAGRITEAAASAVRPGVDAVGARLGRVGRAIRDTATGVAGITTGAGKAAFDEAITQPFGAKPSGSELDLVNEANAGVAEVRRAKNAAYAAALDSIKAEFPKSLDVSPVLDRAKQLFQDYGVKVAPDGTLDLSRSPLIDKGPKLEALMKTIEDWGSTGGDRTVAGVDLLKQRIRSFRTPTDPAFSKLVGELANSAKDVILKSGNEPMVKAYSAMEAAYGKQMDFLDELDRTLGLGGDRTPDQVLTKMNGLLADNKDYRRMLAQEFEAATGKDILGEVAKQRLKSWTPVSLAKYVAGAVGVGGSYFLGPSLLPILALASPRLMAEMFRILGVSGRAAASVLEEINNFRVPAGLGRIKKLFNDGEAEGGAGAAGVPAGTGPEAGGGPSSGRSGVDVYYHGTSAKKFDAFQGITYLTSDPREAEGFANGVHLGGGSGGTPRVIPVRASLNKVKNIDDVVTQALEDGNVDEAIASAVKDAKSTGYDAVSFTHPSTYGSGEFTTFVPTDNAALKLNGDFAQDIPSGKAKKSSSAAGTPADTGPKAGSGPAGAPGTGDHYANVNTEALASSDARLAQEARKYKTADEFVRAQGKPLYHGTNKKFIAFDSSKVGTGEGVDVFGNNANIFGDGVYLTDNKEIADFYAHQVAKKDFIENYTDGPVGTMEPVFKKDADKLAAARKVIVDAVLTGGKILDAETYKITPELENVVIDAFRRTNGVDDLAYARETVKRKLDFYRNNRSKIHGDRGELMYLLDQTLATNKSALNQVNEYLKGEGYSGIKFPSDPRFEKASGSSNYFIFDTGKLFTKEQLHNIYRAASEGR